MEDADRVTLAGAAAVRELVLGQSAFDAEDAFCPPAKTFALAQATLELIDRARAGLAGGTSYSEIDLMPAQSAIAALRSAPTAEQARCTADIARALDRIAPARASAASGRSTQANVPSGDRPQYPADERLT
jgi:vacuolar-type H+-ATPase catalytic subunit A/Vma1